MKITSLLFAVLLGLAPVQQGEPLILVEPVEMNSQTAIKVSMGDVAGSDEAIIQLCYWTTVTNVVEKIVRCHDSILPAFAGVGLLTDLVPASVADIYSVRVRLVKDTYEKRFPYKDKP